MSERLDGQWDRIMAEPQEASNIEFKESVNWEDSKHRLIKCCLGMANHQDGGFIIIGVATDDNKRLVRQGITAEHRDSFRVDDVLDQTNSHADPHVRLILANKEYDGLDYLVIEIAQFEEIPVICKKQSPEKERKQRELYEGRIYARAASGKPQTRVTTHEDLRIILDLAIDIGIRREEAKKQRRGWVSASVQDDAALFRKEAEGL